MVLTFSFRQSAGCGVNQSQLEMLQGEREEVWLKLMLIHIQGLVLQRGFLEKINSCTTQKVLNRASRSDNGELWCLSFNLKLITSV